MPRALHNSHHMTIFEGYSARPGRCRNQADNFPCPVKVTNDEQSEKNYQLPDIALTRQTVGSRDLNATWKEDQAFVRRNYNLDINSI